MWPFWYRKGQFADRYFESQPDFLRGPRLAHHAPLPQEVISPEIREGSQALASLAVRGAATLSAICAN
jgi:hypothetical protein